MTWLPAQVEPLRLHHLWVWRKYLCQSQSCCAPTDDLLIDVAATLFLPLVWLFWRELETVQSSHDGALLWYWVAGTLGDAEKEAETRQHIIFESPQLESSLGGLFRWSIHWHCVTIDSLPLCSYHAGLSDTSHWSRIWFCILIFCTAFFSAAVIWSIRHLWFLNN